MPAALVAGCNPLFLRARSYRMRSSTVTCSLSVNDEPSNLSRALVAGCISAMLLCPNSQALGSLPERNCMKYVAELDAATQLDDYTSEAPLMMNGMTTKNFDPARYQGQWFEVASLKRGFAGQGQEDCHCTQGVYRYDEMNRAINVDTFCAHGSPDGYVTGIRGKVQCFTDKDVKKVGSELERAAMIKERCFLRFPTLPFIPREPYDVLATDYDNYALVSGAKNFSFVQIYSRTPNPGTEFIEKYKTYLATLGYDADAIKETPQDCPETSEDELSAMMAGPGMDAVVTNRFPSTLSLVKPVQLDPFTSVFDTLKKLIKLYFGR